MNTLFTVGLSKNNDGNVQYSIDKQICSHQWRGSFKLFVEQFLISNLVVIHKINTIWADEPSLTNYVEYLLFKTGL